MDFVSTFGIFVSLRRLGFPPFCSFLYYYFFFLHYFLFISCAFAFLLLRLIVPSNGRGRGREMEEAFCAGRMSTGENGRRGGIRRRLCIYCSIRALLFLILSLLLGSIPLGRSREIQNMCSNQCLDLFYSFLCYSEVLVMR